MQYHLGRLIDHVHLRVTDVERSKAFYRAVFTALSRPEVLVEGEGHFFADELFVDQATDYVTGNVATTPATMAPSCSTRTATTSKRSFTAPPSARPHRSSSRPAARHDARCPTAATGDPP
jgi:catechol 2,3-dioxygenase-like lactoylglutathione lyase family enzyme